MDSMITASTKLAGVIGWPITQSRSPLLHGHWLQRYRIDGAYLPLAVAPENLRDAVYGLRALGWRGVNVTQPHKEKVVAFTDTLDEAAHRAQAVNTLIFGEDGRIEGRNTDSYGFLENLRAAAPDWQAKAAPATVIGAGGAAKGVVTALISAGVPEIRIVNRTRARGLDLVTHLKKEAERAGARLQSVSWEEAALSFADIGLLVNASSAGAGDKDKLDIPLDLLPKTALVNDIVYTPLETGLLKETAARGNRTVDGLGMLLHQARPGFSAWFGVMPDVDAALRQAVLRAP
jgi:shikimate dehydrogenase